MACTCEILTDELVKELTKIGFDQVIEAPLRVEVIERNIIPKLIDRTANLEKTSNLIR